MENIIKDKNIKKHTYYFFDDISNTKDFDPNNIKKDKKSWQNILIYYIANVTIKKDLQIYSVNTLYFIFNNVNGYFEGSNGNTYLKLVPTNENKEKIKKNIESYEVKSEI